MIRAYGVQDRTTERVTRGDRRPPARPTCGRARSGPCCSRPTRSSPSSPCPGSCSPVSPSVPAAGCRRASWWRSCSSSRCSSSRSPSSPRSSTRPRRRSPGGARCSTCSTRRSRWPIPVPTAPRSRRSAGDPGRGRLLPLPGHGARWSLRDVDVVIRAGASVALVGATGSGKSTLAKLLVRLADPTAGRVTVHGIPLDTVSFASLRSRMVLVPQEGFLFDATILDNVRFANPTATEADVRLAFSELGLDEWLDTLPHGLDTEVGPAGRVAVGGGAPARVAGPGLRGQPDVPAARRGHLGRRSRHRDPHRPRPRVAVAGPHVDHHRPPPVDRRAVRLGARAGATAAWSSRAPTTTCSPPAASTPASTPAGWP